MRKIVNICVLFLSIIFSVIKAENVVKLKNNISKENESTKNISDNKSLKQADVLNDAISDKNTLSEKNNQINAGVLPGIVSIFPGFILHGSGHLAAGDTDTALNLLLFEGIGLGLFFAGGAALAASGASDKLIYFTAPVIMAGFGLFIFSSLSDIFGSFIGGVQYSNIKHNNLKISTGYMYISDDNFLYENFLVFEPSFHLSHFTLIPLLCFALDDKNQNYKLTSDYELFGSEGLYSFEKIDLSKINILSAFSYYNFDTEEFQIISAEVMVKGRYDLLRFSKSLSGTFVESGLGYSIDFTKYNHNSFNNEDANEQMLLYMAYGILYQTKKADFEFLLFYDHRRDGYAGGMQGGFTGSMGISLYIYKEYFGFKFKFVKGIASIFNINAEFRL
ncbi:MAG: hypothetical protein OEZ22_11405 [Spirochaetia bacterium]|nr:hypothetical protein [Spirochaetia bacterium]